MDSINYLQRYLDIRGITCADIAAATDIGYHTVQKTVKNLRHGAETRERIALFLGLDPVKAWGRGRQLYLRRQIEVEAAKQAEIHRRKTLKKYLDSENLPENGMAVNV